MATLSTMLFSVLIVQVISFAVPNENNVATPRSHVTFDSVANDQTKIENESITNKRQKRFYDYIDFKYPPFYPTNFPYPGQSHYSKRDESTHTGVYGADEAFTQIFRRLRGIIADAKQYTQAPPVPQAPPVTHFTGFVPFLYIPPVGCSCLNPVHNNNRDSSTQNQPKPQVNGNQQPNQGTTPPDFNKRFPEIDDKRQNWGVLVNSTNAPDVNEMNDGNRPISFDPVIPDEEIDVPVPPVEHGSVQAGIAPEDDETLRTSTTPANIPRRPNTASAPYPSFRPQAREPSTCDTAVIACCLQSTMEPNCFQRHGCPDTSIYGRPCAPDVVLSLIKKVEYLYQQKLG